MTAQPTFPAAEDNICAACGMPCEPHEYHPHAACLMFKASGSSTVTRHNLRAVMEHGAQTIKARQGGDATRLRLRERDGAADAPKI